jgi:hypothetical protein
MKISGCAIVVVVTVGRRVAGLRISPNGAVFDHATVLIRRENVDAEMSGKQIGGS